MIANYITEYDPAEIVVTYGGQMITGFQSGTFVTVTKTDDSWSGDSGQGGEGEFVKHNSSWFEVTVTLMSNSASNDILSGFSSTDLTGRAAAVVLDVKNNLGQEKFNAPKARIKKVSDVGFGDTAEGKAWVFLCYAPQMSAGGHSSI